MSETTVTKAVTPTIMPSRVRAERSLCAQIAATATFSTSIRFIATSTNDERVWLLNWRLCRNRYSYLNDSIGSSRAAFHAGHNPKTIPTAAEMPTPTPIAHAGTNAGKGEYLFI